MHQVYLHVIGLANFLCRFALDHLLKVVLYSVSVVLFQKVSALPTDAFYSQYKAKKAWLLIMLPCKVPHSNVQLYFTGKKALSIVNVVTRFLIHFIW